MSDLFSLPEASKVRLLAAGWLECDYWGQKVWRSPDQRAILTGPEALARLDAEEKPE